MKTYMSIAVTLLLMLTTGTKGISQTNRLTYDRIRFIQSEYGKGLIYVKWYSTGRNPAKQFYPFRYENEKPVAVKSFNMIYSKDDSTFFVIQDTIPPVRTEGTLIQYFITPFDTTGKAGESSEIALVNQSGKGWFSKTKADALEKEKGIKVTWLFSDNKMIKHFELHRSTDFYTKYELISTLPADAVEYTDRQIKPDVVYYYTIKAVPADGNNPISSNVIFSAGFNPGAPLPPYIKFAKALKNGAELHIMATDKEAGGVRVYRNDGKSAELYAVSDLLRIPDSLVVVYFDTTSALSGRTTYIYAAKTESTSFVESPLSEKVYIRPLISKPPREPYELTAYEEDGHVRLFWENMQDNDPAIAGYTLKRKELNSKTASFTELSAGGMLLTLNYFTDSTAKPGTAYAYQVNSVDIDGNISKGGSFASVSLQQEIPAQPFALRGYRSDEGIYLQWSRTIYEDIASVNLYRYQKSTKPELIIKLPADAIEYTDANTPEGKSFYYYVTTLNKNGIESKPSEEVVIE